MECFWCVVCYLLSFRTVAFHKVLTHFGFSGHVDVAVGTVAVVTDSLQEVGTHRHLESQTHLCNQSKSGKCFILLESVKRGILSTITNILLYESLNNNLDQHRDEHGGI